MRFTLWTFTTKGWTFERLAFTLLEAATWKLSDPDNHRFKQEA